MKHLRGSAEFSRGWLNAPLAIRAGSQKKRPGAEEQLALRRIVWPCRSLPYGTSRTGSTGPSLPPGWGRFSESRNHLVERASYAFGVPLMRS